MERPLDLYLSAGAFAVIMRATNRCWRRCIMKTKGYILASILNYVGGLCFFLAAIFQEQPVPKYGFFFAAGCLLISGTGFLYTHFKSKSKTGRSGE